MFGVAHIHPHARRLGLAHAQHGQHGIVGGHHVRGPHPLGHPLIQGFDQIGHRPAPHRLRGPRNLESLAGENLFQPVQRQVIGKLAGDDVRQQARPRQSALDRRLRPRRHLHLRPLRRKLRTVRRHTSCAHAEYARSAPAGTRSASSPPRRSPAAPLRSTGKPALSRSTRRPAWLPEDSRSSPAPAFPGAASPAAPRSRAQLRRGNILRVDRFLLQLLAEVQQRLRQLAGRLQPVRARPVVPLLVALQLQLQTQLLHVEIVGALALLRRPAAAPGRALPAPPATAPSASRGLPARRQMMGQRQAHNLDVAIRIWLHPSQDIFFWEVSILPTAQLRPHARALHPAGRS